jgi:hypothetical protein
MVQTVDFDAAVEVTDAPLYNGDDNTTDGWEDPKPHDEAAEWKRKYEELVAERSKPATKPATKPVESAAAEEKEDEKEKDKKKAPRKSAPKPAEEVQQRGNKKQRLTLKQVKAIQRQSVRMERYHQSEMDSAARDTLALAGADSDGDY